MQTPLAQVDPVTAAGFLAEEAHAGLIGYDDHSWLHYLQCVATHPRLTTPEQSAIALLHDAGTPEYSRFGQAELVAKMQASGFTDEVITAVQCLQRPPSSSLNYTNWIHYLRRHKLTRWVKWATATIAIECFSDNVPAERISAWYLATRILESSAGESEPTTRGIAHAVRHHLIPDLHEFTHFRTARFSAATPQLP